MSLVDQIFEQTKLGTAPDPSANPFATGVQLGQNQQRINQAQQQLAMELAQAPLKQTLMQQDAAYKAAQTEQLLHLNQVKVNTAESLAGLAGLVSKAWTESTPDAAIPFFYDALQKNPTLAENPGFQELWKNNETAMHAKALSEHYQAMTQHYQAADAAAMERATSEKDRYIKEAKRIGELTSQLRESQAKTLEPDEGNLEYRAELSKQEAIKAELSSLQRNGSAVVFPEVREYEGKKFLINPKTGAPHQIDKTVSKREFIAQHIGTWLQYNPGMTSTEAAASMGAFYDQFLTDGGAAKTAAPGALLPTPSTAPAYRYNPATGRIEPVKP